MPAPTSTRAGACSNTFTLTPARSIDTAAARPPMPPPTTATDRSSRLIHCVSIPLPVAGRGQGEGPCDGVYHTPRAHTHDPHRARRRRLHGSRAPHLRGRLRPHRRRAHRAGRARCRCPAAPAAGSRDRWSRHARSPWLHRHPRAPLRASLARPHAGRDTRGPLRAGLVRAALRQHHAGRGGGRRPARLPRNAAHGHDDVLRGGHALRRARGGAGRGRGGAPRPKLAHMIHVDDADIALLARRDVKIAHCPSAALKHVKGLSAHGRFADMLDAGVCVSLGGDSANGSNHFDMLRLMYLAALVPKDARLDPGVMPPERVLEMATIHGARALGLDREIGSLEPGKRADLIAFDLDLPEWPPLVDPGNTLVYSPITDSVLTAMVDWRLV